MKKKIYFCLFIIIGLLINTGCEKEKLNTDPELRGLTLGLCKINK